MSSAAALYRRLHAKVVDRDLTDREDAWHCQLALLAEDALGDASLFALQERLTSLVRLMQQREAADPANDV